VHLVDDLRSQMPLLEHPRSQAELDDAAAVELVEFVLCAPWADYWVGCALNWIDAGIWSDKIDKALRAISQDKAFSQRTRHRAWRYVKPRQPPSLSDSERS
jgi:hypothetical protein